MAIKESSDEFNVSRDIAPSAVPVARRARSSKDVLALAIATCGVGYLPLAPGTWGSIVGVGVYLLWQKLWLRFFLALGDGSGIFIGYQALWNALTLVMLVSVTLIGIWAASQTESLSGRKDPGIVVIDEVAGQLITLSIIPHFAYSEWPVILTGFLLFRLFDIWKPYPIRRLETLRSGLGIMADDVVAGMYAATLLSFGCAAYYWVVYYGR